MLSCTRSFALAAKLTLALLLMLLTALTPDAAMQAAPLAETTATTIPLTASQDARTQSGSPDVNFNADILWVGHINVHYSFVQFDLLDLPANATITAAELQLTFPGVYTGTNQVEVGRVEGAWDETTLTWSTQPTITWGGPVQAVTSVGKDDPQTVRWNVTPLVQAWHSGASPNDGFGLRGLDGLLKAFFSKEGDPSRGPTLLITYEAPVDRSARPDLGDAPDSDFNHHGANNTAYAGVLGHFPTVWAGTPANQPAGPRHANQTGEGILGNFLSREAEADAGPDQDGPNNILRNAAGVVVDIADRDRGDDGWRNRNIRFFDCERQTLTVRVSKAPTATLNIMYLNVWFDGNRDGDWADLAQCPANNGGPAQASYEWIVQDRIIDMTAIAPGGFLDFVINTERVFNSSEGLPHWMRFTLSEIPAVTPLGQLADGRGPHPNGPLPAFQFGETEDVFQKPPIQGQPGVLELTKRVITDGEPVEWIDYVTYEIRLRNNGGNQPTQARIRDELPYPLIVTPQVTPQGVTWVNVTSATGGAAPLLAQLHVEPNPAGPPTQVVEWQGVLAPNAEIKLSFLVRVIALCDPNQQTTTFRNLAQARPKNGNPLTAEATFTAKCLGYDEDNIDIEIGGVITNVLDLDDLLHAPWQGEFWNRHPFSVTLGVFQRVPTTTVGAGANGLPSFQVITLDPDEHKLVDLTLRLENEFTDELALPDDYSAVGQVGFCFIFDNSERCPDASRYPQLFGNAPPITYTVRPNDLGDAPDSTNHFAVAMAAYPGVQANYPTVFDPATGLPEGPRHSRPRPFHLGPQVSREAEADIGPDQDPQNNLVPPANDPDNDWFDDGAQFTPLGHCLPADVDARVFISPQAVNWFANQERDAYLNVWIDSNRDGDWADGFTCQDASGANHEVVEHILIDYPIDVAALGAGLHNLANIATQRIAWPQQLADRPTWVRFTLSERESNKTLQFGAIKYGDGRGYANPFRTGETEDRRYVPQGGDGNGPDLALQLAAASTENGLRYRFQIANRGQATASGAHLVFQTPPALRDMEIALVRVDGDGEIDVSALRSQWAAGAVDLPLPDLAPNGIIAILIGLLTDQPSGEIVLDAQVQLAGDIDPSNNQATVNAFGLLSSPIMGGFMDYTDDALIDHVVLGRSITCRSDPQLAGRAAANRSLEIMVDGEVAGTVNSDADGKFFYAANLAEGRHRIYARYTGLASAAVAGQANLMEDEGIHYFKLGVDPSLPFDPMSLYLVDNQGRLIVPVVGQGANPLAALLLSLTPGRTYTLVVNSCGDNPVVSIDLALSDRLTIALDDADRDGTYVGSFTYQLPSVTSAEANANEPWTLTVLGASTESTFGGEIGVAPEGKVTNAAGNLVPNATVTAYAAQEVNGELTYALWDGAAAGQINPVQSGVDGRFVFHAPAGTYRLITTADGYQPYRTGALDATGGVLAADIQLTPVVADETTQVITVDENGFSPAQITLLPGSVIAWENGGLADHGVWRAGADGWDSGLLISGEQFKIKLTALGTYTYVDPTNPAHQATITVANGNFGQQSSLFLPVIGK